MEVKEKDMIPPKDVGHIIWLTGPSGVGKTTLGRKITDYIFERKLPVRFLDGDVVRSFFDQDLGYSRLDRIMNVKRMAFAAFELSQQGVHVVVANIAPYYEVRDFLRKKLPTYIQIYLKASLQTLKDRDVKGLYKLYHDGHQQMMVGLDEPYDVPRNPHLELDTSTHSLEQSYQHITNYFQTKGIFVNNRGFNE
jgi:adenylylsulfate kinase